MLARLSKTGWVFRGGGSCLTLLAGSMFAFKLYPSDIGSGLSHSQPCPMSETYVIVYRTSLPFQADMLGDLLRENGIAARVIGTRHGAAIGAGQHIFQTYIEVPHSQAGEATDFLEGFFDVDGDRDEEMRADPVQLPSEREDGNQETYTKRRSLRPLFAAGASLLLLSGGAHLYTRRPWTAILLVAAQVLALRNLLSSQWHIVATGLVMFGTTLTLDLVGGQLALRAWHRGSGASPACQLTLGAMYFAVAATVGTLLGSQLPEPKQRQQAPVMERLVESTY